MINYIIFGLLAILLLIILVFQIMKNVKNKRIKIAVLIAVVVYILMPQEFIRIEPDEVSSIYLFGGDTGQFATIENRDDIEHIIENLNGISFRKVGLSIGRVGYGFRVKIFDQDEDVYKEFMINSNGMIRWGPFFYRDDTESIDYDYIEDLLEETSSAEKPIEKVTIYRDEDLGISLELPPDWEGRYNVLKDDESMSLYCKSIHDEWEHSGQLFSIIRMTGELITQDDLDQAPMRQKIVLQGNGYTYVLRLPSDVQYPLHDGERAAEYHDMLRDTDKIVGSVSLYGTQQPRVENTGYKVVGTSFFTTEIPSYWDLVPEINSLDWTIREDSKLIGSIQFTSYISERLDPEMDSIYWAFLKDELLK